MNNFLLILFLLASLSFPAFANQNDEFFEVKNDTVQLVKTGNSDSIAKTIQPLSDINQPETIQKHNETSNYKDISNNRVWLVFVLTFVGSLLFYFKGFRWRFVLLLVSVAILGFYQGGCPDSVGASTQVFVNIIKNSHWLLAGVLLAIPLFFSFIFGRTFCSSACPIGALQEFLASKERMFHVSYKTEKLLKWIRLIFFIFLVTISIIRTTYFFETFDPFIALFNFTGNTLQWVLACLILVISIFLFRPFCRYLCPLALWLKVVSRFSVFQIITDSEKCITCGICQKTCPVSAIDINNQVDNSECIRCGKCINVCPKNSLLFIRRK